MDENEHETENPLIEQNWMKYTNWKFMKFVIHHKHFMTPEQLKQKPFKEIIKIQHENLDTEEGESNQDEEEMTTSSDKSEQDSQSDTTTNDNEDEEDSEPTETLQIHNVSNTTLYDEDNSSEPEDDTSSETSENEIQPYTEHGEQNNKQENKLLTTNFEVKVENQKLKGS